MFKLYAGTAIITLVLLYVLFFAYIKLFHKFWYLQPCFHFYNVLNYFKSPQIISNAPSKNNYCNFDNIVTIPFDRASSYQLSSCISLINNHFLRSKNYRLDLVKNFTPYFICHSETSFITVFHNRRTLLDRKTDRVFTDTNTDIIGVITSRPAIMNDSLQINYVDFLCIHTNHRKKGIAEQLIQTHDYNQRITNKAVQVSLFKREGDLMFINPLTRYKSYIRTMTTPNQNPDYLHVTLFTVKDLFNFSNVLKAMKFECIIHPSIAAIVELNETKNIFIYLLKEDDDIIAFYVFKDCCSSAESTISCIASFKSNHVSKSNFVAGFEICLRQLNFSLLVIESISHNGYLIDSTKDKPFINMAYFFYNYIHQTLKPQATFILL